MRRAKDEDKCEKDYVCASGASAFGHSTRQCLNVSIRGVVQNKDSCHGRFLSGGQRQSRANVLARAPSHATWTEIRYLCHMLVAPEARCCALLTRVMRMMRGLGIADRRR